MTIYKLPKDKLAVLLNVLGRDIYSPVKIGEKFQFKKVEDTAKVSLAYPNSAKPPKGVILPQGEILMTYKLKDQTFELSKMPDDGRSKVIFGIRNCDARAMKYLDSQMLKGEFEDPYYKKNRENTTIVGLACNDPPYNCFCKSVGAGPHYKEGHDVHLTELEDSYLVEIISEKGKEMMHNAMSMLSEAGQDDIDKIPGLKEKAESQIFRKIDIKGNHETMMDIFESDYWRDVSDGCLGCGICTLLCPTCFCFDITDIGGRKGGQRVRTWDSCQYPEYTIHASSHNPRPTKKERQRQRFYHKYVYSYKNNQMLGCVGCGRCINQCPVQIDIIDVIEGAKKEAVIE